MVILTLSRLIIAPCGRLRHRDGFNPHFIDEGLEAEQPMEHPRGPTARGSVPSGASGQGPLLAAAGRPPPGPSTSGVCWLSLRVVSAHDAFPGSCPWRVETQPRGDACVSRAGSDQGAGRFWSWGPASPPALAPFCSVSLDESLPLSELSPCICQMQQGRNDRAGGCSLVFLHESRSLGGRPSFGERWRCAGHGSKLFPPLTRVDPAL